MSKDNAFSDSDPLRVPESESEGEGESSSAKARSMRARIESRMEGRSRTNLSTTANAYLKELLRALNFEDGREMNDFIEEGLLHALSKHLAERNEGLPDVPKPLQVKE